MPLYYDPGYGYYGSGGYSSYTPYYITSSYSLYSSPSSSYNRSPVTSNYLHTAKRSNLASSRYKPKLSTISETPLSSTYHHSGLTSLTRIQSPKISPYRNSPKYVAPKPIPINTADIDVSATKYDRRRRSSDNNSERNSIKLRKTSKEEERSSVKSQKSTSDESLNLNNNENKNKSPLMPRVDGTDPGKIRSTIKRDRRVVRLSTVRFKPTSIKEKELKKPENAKHLELPTWRDQLGENQTSMQNAKEKRKNSIEILLEPCIIQSDNNAEDIIQFSNNTGSQIVVEVDPLDPKGVRRLSMTNCPSFHEICEDISSDKIDDDLNAGELRRRASLIQEQEIEILNQLQKSGSGTFHYILERNESQDDCRKSVKRKSTKKGKKVRHKITATVNVENPRLTPILQEVQDDVINTNQTKMSYEVEEIKEEHTVHKIFKLPKKKQKVIKTGSKKSTGSKKEKEKIIENDQHEVKTETMVTESTLQSPNSLFSSKTLTGPEHFTFDIDAVSALDTKENALLSPANLKKEEKPKSPLKSLVPKMPILQNTALKSDTKTTDKIPSSVIENYPKELNVKTLQNAKQAQLSKNTDSNKPESPKVPKTPKVFSKTKVGSSDSGFGELKSPATPKEVCDSVKPKSSIKLQKSESGEDFWSQIGARESLYMVNRRKQLLEQQLKQISAEQETDNEHFESHKKEFNRSESNDSVFSENKIISHDGIKKSSSDNSQLTTNKKTTEINSNKFSDLKQKSEEKQNNQIKQTNKLEKESKISMPAVSQSDCTVETTKTIQPKINSGLLAKIPESKNKQNSNEKFIPSLENKIDIKSSKETNRVEVEVGKSSENVVKKENENTPVDAVKKQNATSPTAINILKNNSNCSASKESGRSDNQGAGAKLKSPPPTDDASVKTTTIKPTTTLAPTVISDNDKNQTKDDYDTKIRTIETGSSKADKTKIIGSLKNSTKRLNDQQTCSEKLLTNTLRENNEELHKTQSSQQQLPPTQTTNEQQEKLKKIIKPTATVADNQKPFETEKTEDITIRSGDNKKQPLFGTNNSDVGSKPATQINQTTIESPPTTITTIKESESKDKGDQTTKFQQSPALSKFATVSDLNRCLLDVDADLSDFIPSEAENSDSSYEEDSNCEEIDENGMKKKNKNGKKKDKDEPAGFNPNKVVKLDHTKKCYVKDEKPPFPLIAKPRPLWKPEKHVYRKSDSNSESDESDESDSECSSSDEYSGDELNSHNSNNNNNNNNGITSLRSDIRMSTCSNDSGFEGGTAPSSPKKMLETSYTFAQFQRSGHITAPATIIPRFKKYSVEDFHFLAVLGKGSFGKVLLAELRNTDYYYAVKCLKKDVVLQDDDVECTLIERKVLALGTKHPYLCHLFCTFQTESHLFFVMEYLNGGDLMFHIQQSGRFPEERARFYGAEIISGLKFLHKKGIIYRDLKLDNVLLDFDGHVRIADFGMCKLQVYLDRTADTFCGTPDYMAPEIIKGDKYNQNVDWWSFGVLLYEMLIGQSPFSGCDEDELFWSICNELPWFPVFLSKEATSILKGLLEKDATCRIGSQYSPAGDICGHQFFRQIDWHQLERRELVPPFKPQVKHPLDTQYFDKAFTRERVRLTPIDKEILQSMDQEQFQGFSYTNPNATLN